MIKSKQNDIDRLTLESTDLKSKEVEIDLVEILYKIINIRKVLYKAIGIGVVIGIIVTLSIPKYYTVQVTLSPEMGNSKGGNGLAGLAASFLGNGAGTSDGGDALNASISADILSSTPFLLELLDIEVGPSEKGIKNTLESYLDSQSSPWWNNVIGLPSKLVYMVKSLLDDKIDSIGVSQLGIIELSEEKNNKVDILRQNISATIDRQTAITRIFIKLQNPLVAAITADSVVHKLQEYITNYRTSKSKEDCVYLEKMYKERQQEYYKAQKEYANYVDTHDNLILQSVRTEQERLQNDMNLAFQVYSQVANQLQIARAKVQEEKPVFAIVEPAVVPLHPSGIGMKIYILLFVFLSVFCAIGWMLLGKGVVEQIKQKEK